MAYSCVFCYIVSRIQWGFLVHFSINCCIYFCKLALHILSLSCRFCPRYNIYHFSSVKKLKVAIQFDKLPSNYIILRLKLYILTSDLFNGAEISDSISLDLNVHVDVFIVNFQVFYPHSSLKHTDYTNSSSLFSDKIQLFRGKQRIEIQYNCVIDCNIRLWTAATLQTVYHCNITVKCDILKIYLSLSCQIFDISSSQHLTGGDAYDVELITITVENIRHLLQIFKILSINRMNSIFCITSASNVINIFYRIFPLYCSPPPFYEKLY